MKIITWNINGLRAVIEKGAVDWALSQTADVVCLQEIKARPEQLTPAQQAKLAAYPVIYWNPAHRPGYSGVATLAKQPADEVVYGLGHPEFDHEGRVIRSRHGAAGDEAGFWLYNIYFPNGQRGQERVDYKLRFYAYLLEQCDRLHAAGEQIILTGDFNTAHREIDLANPKENETTSGFLPEERVWIDYYLEHGFVDIWREMNPERVQYTWWTYITNARRRNVGWRLDYFLVSTSLASRVQDVIIHDEVMGSDHCPVSLTLA